MLPINIDRAEVKATMSVTTDSTPSFNFKLKMRVKILILPIRLTQAVTYVGTIE